MDFGGLIFGSSGILGVPAFAAFSLGLLAAASPCPLATNIAAIAYISQRVTDRRYAITTSALYTLGRMLAYSVLGVLIIKAGLEVPGVASLLQSTGERVLGPILITVGAILLNVHRLRFGTGSAKLSTLGERVSRWGMVGGFLMGILFALAFCPYSAISLDEEKKVSRINDALCKGCGTCVAACPSDAITGKHFTSKQIMAEIEGVLI